MCYLLRSHRVLYSPSHILTTLDEVPLSDELRLVWLKTSEPLSDIALTPTEDSALPLDWGRFASTSAMAAAVSDPLPMGLLLLGLLAVVPFLAERRLATGSVDRDPSSTDSSLLVLRFRLL